MDVKRFDAIASVFRQRSSRRWLGSGLLAVALTDLFAQDQTEAHRKRKRKMKRKKKWGRITILPPPPPPPPPPPQSLLEASCPGPADLIASVGGNQRVAQTFTTLDSGKLTSAQLRLFKIAGSTGDYIPRLQAVGITNTPTNDVFAAAIVSDATVPEGIELTVTFTFAAPPLVAAGTHLALGLTRPGSSGFSYGRRSLSPCAGQGFLSQSQTGPFTSLGQSVDLIFATFVTV